MQERPLSPVLLCLAATAEEVKSDNVMKQSCETIKPSSLTTRPGSTQISAPSSHPMSAWDTPRLQWTINWWSYKLKLALTMLDAEVELSAGKTVGLFSISQSETEIGD
jgi:hypothetical protein